MLLPAFPHGNSIYFFHYASNMKKIRFFIFKNLIAKRMFLFRKRTGLFIRYFPLIRENDVLFLYLKEKGRKRSKPACRWTAGAYGNCIPQSPLALRESVPMAHVSLDERDFAARGSLGNFDRLEAFLLVRLRDGDSPKRLF